MMKRLISVLLAFALLLCCCAASADSALPSRYDMRDDGIVTPVKLQYPWGCCWCYGAIAAAETAILSSMGKTYEEYPLDLSELHATLFAKLPITEADDPTQVGEGRRVDPDASPKEQAKDVMSGGSQDIVASLFASGGGPVDESVYPYHGQEARPEAWVIEKNPEQWIEDYMHTNSNKVRSAEDDRPAFTEEDLRAEAEAELKKKQAEIETGYYLLWYSEDDWSIPRTNAEGKSNRFQPSSWILKDSNSLPEMTVRSVSADGESVCVPDEANMAAIKREMLMGHAPAVSYYAESYSPAGDNPNLYTNYETWAQYTYESAGKNHTVCLVGWDDDYPAENFTHDVYVTDENGNRVLDKERTAKTTPPGNGAWLIKNSRGSETDAIPDGMKAPDGTVYPEHRSNYGIVNEEGLHTGYNWISYYDQSICMPLTLEFTYREDPEHTRVLQYDYLYQWTMSLEQSTKQSDQPLSAANVFTADRDLEVTAVTIRGFTADTRVDFRIVKLNENAKDPEDGQELKRFTEHFPYAGIHMTELDKPVPLKKGDRFSVITTTSFIEKDGKRNWVYEALGNVTPFMEAVINPGESFAKENGKWQDWKEMQDAGLIGGAMEEDEEDPLFGPDTDPVIDNFTITACVRYDD